MLPDKEVLIPMCTSIKTSRRFGIGNVRVSYSRDPQTGIARIVEENNYYPYGLQHSGYNNDVWLNQANTEGQKITFNSRELQNEFDLFVVAMDFRQYDPALGRFTAMDRLAAFAPGITPYRFAFNNPNYWSDPTGLFESKNKALQFISDNGLEGASVTYNSEFDTWYVHFNNISIYQSRSGKYVVAFGPDTGYTVQVMPSNWGGSSGGSGGGIVGGWGFSGSYWGGSYDGGSNNNNYDFTNITNSLTVGGASLFTLEKSIHNSRYWVDAKGKIRSTSLLKKQANGKHVKGVQGLRNSRNATARIASNYSLAGKVIGGIGVAITFHQWNSGQISDTQAVVDGLMGVVGLLPGGAAISLTYFAGKALYEYFSGETLFEKPN